MEKPNKLMTWKEIKEKYPDKRFFVEVVEGDATNFKTGTVQVVAVEDGRLAKSMKYCMLQGCNDTFSRTAIEPSGRVAAKTIANILSLEELIKYMFK